MGCACVKSDVVVKNQRSKNRNSESSVNKESNRDNYKTESASKIKNLLRNIKVRDSKILSNDVNMNRNSQSNNRAINLRDSNSNMRENFRNFIQINNISNNNEIQNSMPFLAGLNNPDFNFPEICI